MHNKVFHPVTVGVLMVFSSALFLSAFLLFSIQPMFTKILLPTLGGSPAVWNTAMLFFQTMLVLGYVYSHCIRTFRLHRQIICHVLVLIIACVVLPLSTSGNAPPISGGSPIFWVLGALAISVGLPFFALSANAPLLQYWFAKTNHPLSQDPYFLYAASNLGSILALLTYPLLFEPNLDLWSQGISWSIGYLVLVLTVFVCGALLWLGSARGPNSETTIVSHLVAKATLHHRIRWVLLAFAPSSLMLGVTAHITTEIAAVPLLWVIPLTIYLLTFVIAFAGKPLIPHKWVVKVQPFVVIVLVMVVWNPVLPSLLLILPNLLLFFVTAMMCHGELVRLRPKVDDLTQFYIWIAVGGMLGGIFNALVAPLLFDYVLEYAITLVFACALRPTGEKDTWKMPSYGDFIYPGLVLGIALLLPVYFGWRLGSVEHAGIFVLLAAGILLVVLALFTYSFRQRSVRYALGVASILIVSNLLFSSSDQLIDSERSFFGVHKVKVTESGKFRYLIHGSTIHGAQHTAPALWAEPLTYFHREGPIGQLFSAEELPFSSIGVLGLGTGTLACYRRAGQKWTFFEIDPLVERIARNSGNFRYLETCAPDADIVMGDARLSLKNFRNDSFDLLVVDAFSSDSVPVHLVTSEAMDLYLSKLSPGGLVVFNISNRYMDFTNVLGALAEQKKLVAVVQRYSGSLEEFSTSFKAASHWVVMARKDDHLRFLVKNAEWKPLVSDKDFRLWTDDFSNIVSVIKWLN